MNVDNIWYKQNIFQYILFPFSLIYLLIIVIRRMLYQFHILKSYRAPVPVIIVGNITVGGTGKTPLVIAIANALKKYGLHPGIITRGYRGKNKTWPILVNETADPALVGDEAVLMAKQTKLPIVAGPNRAENVRLLLKTNACNVIISDDGLQHYALARDIEIAVIDGTRQCGNGFCLPAGPLREPRSQLDSVDFVVINDGGILCQQPSVNDVTDIKTTYQKPSVSENTRYSMHFDIITIQNILNSTILALPITKSVFAVAGIGNPQRFFNSLRELSIPFIEKTFPDHHAFNKQDFNFASPDSIIILTEKDAVKCVTFADERFYVAKGVAKIDEDFFVSLVKRCLSYKASR